MVVVEARHMRVSLSTMRNKTDRNDARGIAQMMRLGWFRAVHIKNDYEGRITKQGDVSVREALCEAAASLLLRVRKWSALRAWGLRIAKRSSMLCAIVAVARKLAGILHRMWISETDFHVASVPR